MARRRVQSPFVTVGGTRTLSQSGGRSFKAGSVRKVTVSSDRLTVAAPDDGVAVAMRQEVQAQIRKIRRPVSPASQTRRQAEGRGRQKFFANDTGHLAATLSMQPRHRAHHDTYLLLAPPDRLGPDHFRNMASYESFRRRLLEFVPALGEPRRLWETSRVKRAAKRTLRAMTHVQRKARRR